MERRLIVAHLSADPGLRDSAVSRTIEELGEWIEVDRSAYLLWTSLRPDEVRDQIGRVLPSNDRIAVLNADEFLGTFPGELLASSDASRPAAGSGLH